MCADNEKLILDSLEFSVISEGECFSPKLHLIGGIPFKEKIN